MNKGLGTGSAALLLLMTVAACARTVEAAQQQAAPAGGTFVTLGTMGGPIPNPVRSQPANLLVQGEDGYLVDVGDGTAQRLAQAGIPLRMLRGVFISHLHFDHTGGLGAILGLRYQTNAPGVLTVYGPPGTRQLVDGIVASMRPGAEAGYGIPGAPRIDPESGVRVVELRGGAKVDLPRMTVLTAKNSHYSFVPGSAEDRKFESLSYRFELGRRSIVYTGDTGPSAAVERLARGADLLVSEMIDLEATLATVRRNSPDMPPAAFANAARHLGDHHLSPEQVGQLAARAGVRRLVVTHIVPGLIGEAERAKYLRDIAKHFRGPAEIADDLDRF